MAAILVVVQTKEDTAFKHRTKKAFALMGTLLGSYVAR